MGFLNLWEKGQVGRIMFINKELSIIQTNFWPLIHLSFIQLVIQAHPPSLTPHINPCHQPQSLPPLSQPAIYSTFNSLASNGESLWNLEIWYTKVLLKIKIFSMPPWDYTSPWFVFSLQCSWRIFLNFQKRGYFFASKILQIQTKRGVFLRKNPWKGWFLKRP